ncbi:hypothetical protein SUDANB106_03696 [Streptomyces sp. enrichment culture]|uniref:polymorphic toxin-type HINT domain-containing protein n=1 Tax=Streptomyces sp. enrichment culture TaxID=1795815 RepID=UPI003F578CA0
MVVVVVAIVGGLVAAGVTTELGQSIGAKICRVVGGQCGPAGGGDGGEGGQQPVADGTGGGQAPAGDTRTREEKEYEQAVRDLEAAREALEGDEEKAKEAAKELAKILAEELGITDALDCITEGDGAACTETLINVLTSLIGGAVGKLAAKYGAPWKWKKAVELVRKIKKHGGDLYDGLKGIIDGSKKVDRLEDKVEELEKKLPDKDRKPGEPGTKKPVACRNHSFPPGTPVLLADGSRRPIEEVRAGELVTVTDPYRGLTTVRPVAGTITTEDDKDFTRLTVLAGGRAATLTATDTHPFWLVDEARWAEAGGIRPGDELRTPGGAALRVVEVERYERRQRTHDLSIEDIHTYYVGVGTENALVHNCSWSESFDKLPDGKQKGSVKVVEDVGELRKHFDEWTKGAEKLPPRGEKIPDVYRLEDGTVIQWRKTSASGGETIDIFPPGQKPKKVHIDHGS